MGTPPARIMRITWRVGGVGWALDDCRARGKIRRRGVLGFCIRGRLENGPVMLGAPSAQLMLMMRASGGGSGARDGPSV